jgi:DNA-directed RNA polymerase specialized sigma24 family protein
MEAGAPGTGDRAHTKSADTSRQKWTLTQEAFDRLLASLNPDRDTAADRYLQIRSKLVRLFEWRGFCTPDEYADETINRCAKKISEGEPIHDAQTYCMGIARMLAREMNRERARAPRPLEEAPEPRTLPPESESNTQGRLECLRKCLDGLSLETRNLILHYYQGESGDKLRNRSRLTQVLGIAPGTLRMRALRIRDRLQLCAENCMERQEGK